MTFETVRLGDVTDYIRGITFKPADVVQPHSPNSVVCMTTKNVQELLDETKLTAVPPRFVKRDEQYLQLGDILISSANSWNLVGKATYVPELPYAATAGGFISILRAQAQKVDCRYLYHWVASGETQHRARLCARQTTNIANLDRERFLGFKIPLPSLAEQRRIAAILDKADAVRRKRQQTLNLADQFLRSAFLDLFGDPVTNPKGWPVKKLGEFADIRSGVTKGRKLGEVETVLVPYMRVANVQDGKLDLLDIKEIEIRTDELEKYRLHAGDLLLTEGGDPDKLGRGAVWTGLIEPCVHQNHIFSVRVDKCVADPQYLSAQIGSEYGKRHFLRLGKQTTGIATINKTQLRGFPALLPPIQLQRQYALVVTQFEESLRRLSRTLDTHDDLLRSLTQRAFRGEL